MTLILNLPIELEQYLLHESTQKGLPVEALALQLLEKSVLYKKQKREAAIALLQSWIDDDDEEQKETGQFLIQALDEDRLSDRKLFPPEMKGISW